MTWAPTSGLVGLMLPRQDNDCKVSDTETEQQVTYTMEWHRPESSGSCCSILTRLFFAEILLCCLLLGFWDYVWFLPFSKPSPPTCWMILYVTDVFPIHFHHHSYNGGFLLFSVLRILTGSIPQSTCCFHHCLFAMLNLCIECLSYFSLFFPYQAQILLSLF